ncbi:MAG: DivIVA domain-containing protein [Pelotomaculum sp.]|uniref:Cell division initiation protein n=1 Tax=Pelotomaculum thermopropionicum (strain DSM 13744 / JCM 10971 / SI) TaxID=370438 RepID=A5D183_PELTS|nr:DivIVA domain-containing protein [Pelotomaculum sp.]BAF60005.1 cell division initiation protein [Pelotomaculum thermopropionicum SI]
MLTPLDIQKKEFRRAFRGYSEEEVDSFLDQVIQDYENLYRENQELKEKLAQADRNLARYREIEEVLKNTMVMAQKNADDLRQNTEKETSLMLDRARIEAERLTREAEQEAEALIRDAEQKASEILAGAEKKLKQAMEECHRYEKEAQVFRMRLRSFLEAQIKLLDSEEQGFSPGREDEDA